MGLREFLGITERAAAPAPRPLRRMPRRPSRRGWDPAEQGRLFSDWTLSRGSADEEVRLRAETERARSRELERSNPWAVRYFRLWVANVIGENGIRLVPAVVNVNPGPDGRPVRTPDVEANDLIRAGFKQWGRYGSPTVCGRYSWVGVQKALGVSWKRDGEAFARFYRGEGFGEFGFRLGLLEADHCPSSLDRDLQNGNRIKGGLELDRYGRSVAFWFNPVHPGDARRSSIGPLDRFERIPADEVIHLYDPKRIAQTRGLPELEAGITSLHMLGGYEEAELVAARAGASKLGFIYSETPEGYEGSGDDELEETAIGQTLEPGTLETLSEGQKFEGFDPTHPTTAFVPFLKQMLRRFSGVGAASYNSVANDLEGVNFSSLRDGKLSERDQWKMEQGHLIEVALERSYLEGWLPSALLSGQLGNLPPTRLDKFSAHRWQGRRWEWIDPVKEAQGNELELDNLTTSLTQIASSKGGELRELFEEISAERTLAAEYGLEELLPYGGDRRPGATAPPEAE